MTLVATLALGMESLRTHAPSGHVQMAGLALCCVSACAMGLWKGPVLFGLPPSGAHAPTNIPLGASFMIFNCVISAMVQARAFGVTRAKKKNFPDALCPSRLSTRRLWQSTRC